MSNRVRNRFLYAANTEGFTPGGAITRKQVIDVCRKHGIKHPSWLTTPGNTVARGVYRIPGGATPAPAAPAIVSPSVASAHLAPAVEAVDEPDALDRGGESQPAPAPSAFSALAMTGGASHTLVPSHNSLFVPFGFYADLRQVIQSGRFFPAYITGLSGNGKTTGIEQACAELNRELFRVNITEETDEDDLLGGFRLRDGATVFDEGPVVKAMRRGAVLLLDEIDLASSKIMCLQPVLEGKGVFLKKIGEWVTPLPGFTVIATANTKGKGSDDGRFVGTGALNEAFLDRFPLTYEQDYPSAAVERKILTKIAESTAPAAGVLSKVGITSLLDWAQLNRKQFADGGISEVISTRRLVNIVTAYGIFGDLKKSVKQCINRFDTDTQKALGDAFDKIYVDETQKSATPTAAAAASVTINFDSSKCPF